MLFKNVFKLQCYSCSCYKFFSSPFPLLFPYLLHSWYKNWFKNVHQRIKQSQTVTKWGSYRSNSFIALPCWHLWGTWQQSNWTVSYNVAETLCVCIYVQYLLLEVYDSLLLHMPLFYGVQKALTFQFNQSKIEVINYKNHSFLSPSLPPSFTENVCSQT